MVIKHKFFLKKLKVELNQFCNLNNVPHYYYSIDIWAEINTKRIKNFEIKLLLIKTILVVFWYFIQQNRKNRLRLWGIFCFSFIKLRFTSRSQKMLASNLADDVCMFCPLKNMLAWPSILDKVFTKKRIQPCSHSRVYSAQYHTDS